MNISRLFQRIKYNCKPNISFFADIVNSNIDKKTKIARFVKLYRCSIGAHSYIGAGSKLFFTQIGKFCSIGGDCKIGSASHPLNFISTSPIFYEPGNITGEKWVKKIKYSNSYKHTIIGNDVWIGSNAIIMGGVRIGDGAVIGAGAVVTKDVEPFSIVGGVPAKLIRKRFQDNIVQSLSASKWWTKDDKILKKNLELFTQDLSNPLFFNKFTEIFGNNISQSEMGGVSNSFTAT